MHPHCSHNPRACQGSASHVTLIQLYMLGSLLGLRSTICLSELPSSQACDKKDASSSLAPPLLGRLQGLFRMSLTGGLSCEMHTLCSNVKVLARVPNVMLGCPPDYKLRICFVSAGPPGLQQCYQHAPHSHTQRPVPTCCQTMQLLAPGIC